MSGTITPPSGILVPFDYAAQWAEDEITELTLPSGKKVQVRQPDVLTMAKQGLIPDHLTPIVERFVFDQAGMLRRTNAPDQPPGERLKGYADYMRYVDVVVVGACVNPVVRFKPKAGEVAVERLSTADRIHIWQWSEGLATDLAAFPDDGDGAGAGVPAVADGAGTGAAAEPADRADIPA